MKDESPEIPAIDLGKRSGYSSAETKMHRQLTMAYSAILMMGIAILALVLSLFYFASREPLRYVVHVDENNNAVYGGTLTEMIDDVEKFIPTQLARFIEKWKTVSGDNTLLKKNVDSLYCFVLGDGPAHTKMNDYFRNDENNPFEINKAESRVVEMRSIVKQTTQTWSAQWREIRRDHRGKILGEDQYQATIQVVKGPMIGDCAMANPLSIYIDDINWTRVMQ